MRGWMLGLALMLGAAIHGAERVAKEYSLKSAFLFNFAQFVEWPTNAFARSDSPLVIGVLGENPFGSVLADTVKGEQISGRSLVVKYFGASDDFSACQILFISRSEKEREAAVLSRLKGKPTLIVSEQERFGQRGGMVNFVMRETMRFEINREAVEAAGLKISSKLLNLAIPVKTESP